MGNHIRSIQLLRSYVRVYPLDNDVQRRPQNQPRLVLSLSWACPGGSRGVSPGGETRGPGPRLGGRGRVTIETPPTPHMGGFPYCLCEKFDTWILHRLCLIKVTYFLCEKFH